MTTGFSQAATTARPRRGTPSLAGARMLIVGGSSGIGLEIGLAAARDRARVAFAGRRKDRLDEAVAVSGGGYAVSIDVTDASSVESAVEEVVALYGGLDVVVYASGVAAIAPIAEETESSLQRVFATNVIGAATVARCVLPHLDEHGLVLLTSSSNTHHRLWGLNGYGASKAALDRLVDGLRDEHPDVRWIRLAIGPTLGTDFGGNFDDDAVKEAMARWIVGGHYTATTMSAEDVGAFATGLLGLLYTNPGVEVPVLQLEPPAQR